MKSAMNWPNRGKDQMALQDEDFVELAEVQCQKMSAAWSTVTPSRKYPRSAMNWARCRIRVRR